VARDIGVSDDWADVFSLAPADVPRWLVRARAAVFLYKPGLYAKASFPTKFAEALAVGLPVIANRGIGDLDGIVEAEGVGVLVGGFSEDAYRAGLERLRGLLSDPDTPSRCRRLAEKSYGVGSAVAKYRKLYESLRPEDSAGVPLHTS
jgi:glycosyltransferase involved in cell wall biosynthesis